MIDPAYPAAHDDHPPVDGLRDLPWRRTRDPWKVLVSEVMLQQTQADRVVPAYTEFVDRFPTVESCAAAPLGDVLTAWQGLGYNRRARNLHRCARAIVAEHGGRVPSDLGALIALPGVGPYTSRAVQAFAFEIDTAVVDVNVSRVLSRFNGRALTLNEAQHIADAEVPSGAAWLWNQSMLDHGALTCTARRPACTECKFADACSWNQKGGNDPAVRANDLSRRQSTFEGSDRQGRGRLVEALRRGPVTRNALPEVMGWPDDGARAFDVAEKVVSDGLAVVDGNYFRLPS